MNFVKNKSKKYKISHFMFLILLFFCINIIGCSQSNEVNNNVSKDKVTTEQKKHATNNEATNNQNDNLKEKQLSSNILKKSDIQFDKKELKKESNINFNTPWEKSPNGKISVCIEGKGEESEEEGIGKICIKSSENNVWSFDIISSKKQITPKDVEWLDNENLLVIAGQAYGTTSKGGKIYILNTNTGECYLLYDTKDVKKEIVSCKVKQQDSNKVNIEMVMSEYEDDNFTKCNNKNLIIKDMDLDFSKVIDILDEDGKVFDTIK